ADGRFRLAALDPALDFCITALAAGYEPAVQSKLVPEAGPVTVKLRARNFAGLAPERHVAGRLLGPDGAPVAGAVIDVGGIEKGGSTQWGGNDTTDDLAVTDAEGEFHLAGRKDFTAVQARVNTPGLAARWVRLEPGKMCLLRLRPGAAVRGRLVRDGQPLRGVVLGLCTETRECGKDFMGFQATTDDEGRFVFPHVPAGLRCQVFGKMDSLRPLGAACRRDLVSAPDGGTNDLGDWSAEPAHRLAGRVVLADGSPVPPATRLMLDRTAAWDTTLATLDAEGRFEVTSVPAEQVGLHIAVAGYHLSQKNPNLDLNSRGSLTGRLTGDLAAMDILLEPGPGPNWNDIDRPSYEEMQAAEQKPLAGFQAR
ncbi:MAG: carboxypeptidase regulatory-like domain-containing protein, partial [Gluconacetobacter diazotrophicus]|nr:carboxypeptidase regulatory-like domain-containing protein [Gluconacetobacter diazotrophicus]